MSAKYMFRYIHWIENVSYMLLFSLGYNPYSCVSVKIAIELYKQAEESDAYVSDFGVADKSAWVIQKKEYLEFFTRFALFTRNLHCSTEVACQHELPPRTRKYIEPRKKRKLRGLYWPQ